MEGRKKFVNGPVSDTKAEAMGRLRDLLEVLTAQLWRRVEEKISTDDEEMTGISYEENPSKNHEGQLAASPRESSSKRLKIARPNPGRGE